MRTDVDEVAGTFVASSVAQSFLHNLFLFNFESHVVIVLPPALAYPIVNVRVVMTIFSKAIVNQYSVQLVRSFLVFDVG